MNGVAVVVRAAQPIRDQRARVHHGDIVEMGQKALPHRPDLFQRRDQRLLVAGDMRIAQDRDPLRHGIIRLRGVNLRAVQALFFQKTVRLFGGGPHDVRQQTHEIVRQIARIPGDLQLADAVFLPDLPRLVRQFLLKDLLGEEGRVAVQDLCPYSALVVVIQLRIRAIRAEVRELPVLVGDRVVVGGLRGLGQPCAVCLFRRSVPAQRQLLRAVLLGGDGSGVQKLEVQLGQPVPAAPIHVGDEQPVLILPAAGQILFPVQAVFPHPAPALAHALREDHVDLADRVADALDVLDLGHAQALEQRVKIHLMHHALDVGQPDLLGKMVVRFIGKGIEIMTQLG